MAASGDVEIINSALLKIGEDPIASASETNKRARVGVRLYEEKRKELLVSSRWTFSIERAELALDATAPAFGFTHQFVLPADCLRVLGLYDANQGLHQYTATDKIWKVEGRRFLYTESTARVFYVRDVITVPDFDPLFDVALALRIAMDAAYALGNGQSRIPQLAQDFERTLREAKKINAVIGTPEQIVSTEWLDSRNYDDVEFPSRIGPVATD